MIRYISNIMALSATCAVLMLMSVSCGGRTEKIVEMGPDVTVETFYNCLTAGDFSAAKEICDTVTMKEYIETYSEAWDMLRKKDSTVAGIAAEILNAADIDIIENTKEDNKRIIKFNISSGTESKEKKAVVRKDEGIWKIEGISDRN